MENPNIGWEATGRGLTRQGESCPGRTGVDAVYSVGTGPRRDSPATDPEARPVTCSVT